MALERYVASAAAVVLSTLIAGGQVELAERGSSDDVLVVQIDGRRFRLKIEPDTGLQSSNVQYVNWRKDRSQLGDVYPPLDEDHPAYIEHCFLCDRPLGNGQLVQLLIWGPTTREDRIAHYRGEEYSALATYVHAVCAQGEPGMAT